MADQHNKNQNQGNQGQHGQQNKHEQKSAHQGQGQHQGQHGKSASGSDQKHGQNKE